VSQYEACAITRGDIVPRHRITDAHPTVLHQTGQKAHSCGTSPVHLLLIDKHHGRASEGKNELSEYPKIHPHLRWALGGVVMLIRRYCYVGEASQLSDPGLDKRKLLLTLPVALTDVADSWFLIVGVPESAT
jgi:hypothetical protein